MATEDVIELDSSDEDAEPVPKKAKTVINPVTRIPRYLKEVSIKPAKSDASSLSTKLVGKTLTIKKVINNVSIKPVSTEKESAKTNGKAVRKQQRQVIKPLQKPIPVKHALNPISVKMSNSQMVINKVPAKIFNEPMKICNLPPGVTIKKTLPTQMVVLGNNGKKLNEQVKTIKVFNNSSYPKVNVMPAVKMMPKKAPSKSSVGKVFTVDLDDDDVNPGTVSGPQWYLRPEEQEQRDKIEKQNNSEPQCSNLVEITIEDSPIKPVSNKNEIGTEYAITIEDSPLKLVADGNKSLNDSDEEIQRMHRPPKSKKQLKYLKNDDDTKTVEIELEPIEVFESSQEVNKNEMFVKSDNDENEKYKNSIFKETEVPKIPLNTDAAEKLQTELNLETKNKEENEFHPVYRSFIDLCFELENSDDMQKIVEKKIKGYYKQVPKEYTESEEFIDLVTGKINAMKADPGKMYLYIKDIVDELNYKRKSLKTNASSIPEVKDGNETENSLYEEESEFDSKRQRQIRKLEKTLKKLHRAIQKLEEQEVDFDDEEDSVYLLTERYKARMIRVHAKFCQMTNTKMPSEPRVHIDPRPGQPAGPAKRLEKWVNKKVPIGTPLPFPDFHDVLQCVREANKEDKLGWNEADVMDEARDLFLRCGKKLQRRRQENEWRLAASRISQESDPTIDNEELKKKLQQNQLLAVKKETELFNKYAEKQSEMKLEAVEIGDKEAEESPVETEDDDTDEEDASLGNTEKRKQRLKRLIQQKKDNEKTDNQEKGNPDKDEKLEDTEKKDVKAEDEITATQLESSQTPNKQVTVIEGVQSLSDDSSNMNSDVDELHLLQKLHSEPELCTSTLESSDSGSPIAISDTLDSSSDSIKAASDDVISIENSSYSENEDHETEDVTAKKPAEPSEVGIVKKCNTNLEIDCSTVFNVATEADVEKKFSKSNNDEYSQSVEDILLASTDEDTADGTLLNDNGNVYVNLNDDALSIEETIIVSKNSPVSNDPSSTKDDAISLEEKSSQSEDNYTEKEVPQQMEVGSLQEKSVNNDKSEEALLLEISSNDNVIVVTSISGSDMKADTTSCSTNERKDHESRDKHENNCATSDEVVDSSTELMEVVTTTSSDGVNG